jgi:hypothetical protein
VHLSVSGTRAVGMRTVGFPAAKMCFMLRVDLSLPKGPVWPCVLKYYELNAAKPLFSVFPQEVQFQ